MKAAWTQRLRACGRAHAEWCWAPALYALAVAVLYRQIWSGEQGFGWDTIETYWGDLAYLSRQLAGAEWSLWNPYDRGGYPAHADPQPGTYYPIHWLFAGLGALLGGVSWWLIQLKMLLHHVIAGATLHLFLRARGLPRTAAVCGGVAWIAGAPMLIHKASNVLLPMAWTPLIWVLTDRLVARPTWRRGCALAAGLYLAGAAGSPPGFFYTLLMAVGYGGFRLAQALVDAYRQGALARTCRDLGVALGVAGAITVAMLLVVVVPGLDLAAHSPRAERGLAYALSVPLSVPGTMVGFLQPHLGRYDAYAGVLALMLALCGVLMRPRRDRGAPLFFVAAAGFFLCLSFGAATPLLRWLVESVPGFGLFRIASRYKLLSALMIAALAGYGAANLLAAARTWGRERVAAVAVALAVAGAVGLVVALLELPQKGVFRPVSTSVVLAALSAGLIVGAALHARRAAAILVAIMPLLMLYDPDHFVHVRGPVMEKRPDPGRVELLRELEDIDTKWRIYDEYVVGQRPGPRFGVRDLRGYPSGDPLDLVRYRDILAYARTRPEILTDYNVRYVLHGPHHRNGTHANHIKRPPSQLAPAHFRRLDARRYEAVHPAPLVMWYGAVRVAAGPEQVLEQVRAAQGPDGTRTHAVLEPAEVGALAAAIGHARMDALIAAEARPGVAGELVQYGADELRVRVRAPGPGLVVLNEIQYPGWKARVDGAPAAAVTANHVLRAVAVAGGEHDIVWTYEPPRMGALVLLWWLGALALLAACVWPRRPRAAG